MADYRCSFDFDWILEERQIVLSLQEMGLERREEWLMKEQTRGLSRRAGPIG
jgi:hypothetical protein